MADLVQKATDETEDMSTACLGAFEEGSLDAVVLAMMEHAVMETEQAETAKLRDLEVALASKLDDLLTTRLGLGEIVVDEYPCQVDQFSFSMRLKDKECGVLWGIDKPDLRDLRAEPVLVASVPCEAETCNGERYREIIIPSDLAILADGGGRPCEKCKEARKAKAYGERIEALVRSIVAEEMSFFEASR